MYIVRRLSRFSRLTSKTEDDRLGYGSSDDSSFTATLSIQKVCVFIMRAIVLLNFHYTDLLKGESYSVTGAVRVPMPFTCARMN